MKCHFKSSIQTGLDIKSRILIQPLKSDLKSSPVFIVGFEIVRRVALDSFYWTLQSNRLWPASEPLTTFSINPCSMPNEFILIWRWFKIISKHFGKLAEYFDSKTWSTATVSRKVCHCRRCLSLRRLRVLLRSTQIERDSATRREFSVFKNK
jgi:hypothetical protein